MTGAGGVIHHPPLGTGLTGPAASLTAGAISNLTVMTTRDATNLNSRLTTGFFAAEGLPTNAPTPRGGSAAAKSIDTGLQIAGGYSSDNLYFRGGGASGATFHPAAGWRTVVHSGNIASQAVASAGTVTTAAQPNITSVGTLTGLNLSGAITAQQSIYLRGGGNPAPVTCYSATSTTPASNTAFVMTQTAVNRITYNGTSATIVLMQC